MIDAKKGWTGRLPGWLALFCLAACPLAGLGQEKSEGPAAGAAGQKKLIEWGWDEPDTKFIREHIREMEQFPFDGLIFHIVTRSGENFTWKTWGRQKFELSEFQHAIDNLKATNFRRFTERFLRVNVIPGDVDWFDDEAGAAVEHNFGVAAEVARQGGCRGFMFDVEQYQHALFSFAEQKGRSFAQCQAKVRERGRQWMRQINAHFPDITILMTFGYRIAQPSGKEKDRSQARYGLLADFLDGMLDACSDQTTIVDAWEYAYPYKEARQFQEAYETITTKALQWTESPEKYRAHMQAGFGIWMDCHWRSVGWHLDDLTKNHFTPDEFERSVRAALRRTDRYVWIYTEQPRWWTKRRLPQAYVAALAQARRPESDGDRQRRDAGPGIRRRPDGRMTVGYRLDAPLPEDDPDYQMFYRYVPRDQFMAARRESCPPRPAGRQFEFLSLDYPMGDGNPTSYRFDMGPPDAPVKAGWTRVTRDDMFSWQKGYGWSVQQPANDYAFDGRFQYQKGADYAVVQNQGIRRVYRQRGRPCDLAPIRQSAGPHTLEFYKTFLDEVATDAVLNPDLLAFKVALPNGRYLVSMVIGDLQIPRYGMDVYANGRLVASNIYTGLNQFRGYTEPSSPWPVRIAFPVNVVRRNMRIALRANPNNFLERCEVMAETPDYNYSQLAYGRLNPFFGKRMALHGPPTQMAIAGITITPYEEPPLALVRQRLLADREMKNPDALEAVQRFNAGDLKGAEECFDRIGQSEAMLKTLGYLAIVGLIDTPLDQEERLLTKAIGVLQQHCRAHSDDIRAAELLQLCRYYKAGVWRKMHASELNLSVCYPEAACLFSWVTPNDIFYSKALSHYGRCFSAIDAHRWCPTWQMAEEAFMKLEEIEPRNRISGYYLYGDITGWDFKDYTAGTRGAPKWAVQLREAYGRVIDQIEWWGRHRQRPDGGLGGGWGDDVEIGLVWQWALLVNPDYSAQARRTVQAIAEGVWWSGEVDRDRGFFDGLADVEHTAEWTGDSQAVMMGVEYGNPIYFERNLKTARLMRDLWMGESRRGHLHFKSMMLGNRRISKRRGNGQDAQFDHPLNGRGALSAYWDWWYCPLDGLDDLFTRWAEAWCEDSQRAENGKPPWIIPGPVGFPSDTLGGNQATAWRRGSPRTNAYDNPTYTEYILNLFASMYARTGQEKWLRPKAVVLDSKGIVEGQFAAVRPLVEDFAIRDKYAAMAAIPNRFGKGEGIQSILDGFPRRWPSCTSEVASTDRIVLAGTVEIISFLTGGNVLGGLRFTPVTLADTSRDIIFLPIASGSDHAKVIFFNFSSEDQSVHARLWKLQVGAPYRVRIGIDRNDDDRIDQQIAARTYRHAHRGDPIDFTVPGRKAVVLEVSQTEKGAGMPERAVDLAMAPEDITCEDGKLTVTVHNIGNKACGPFTLNVWLGEAAKGRLLKAIQVDGLEAPNDLQPRTVSRSIPWQLPESATLQAPAKITVEIDPDDRHYEITEVNNTVSRTFPFRQPAWRIPRVWPSLVEQYPQYHLKKYQPFPKDFPKRDVR